MKMTVFENFIQSRTPTRTKIALAAAGALFLLVCAGTFRWPSARWARIVEEYLSETVGVPVTVDRFSTGVFRSSVAEGVKITNIEPFARLGPVVEMEKVVLRHRLLARLFGREDVTGASLYGVTFRVGRAGEAGWNIVPLDWKNVFAEQQGPPGKFVIRGNDLYIDQARVLLILPDGSSNSLFANIQVAWTGIRTETSSRLKVTSESSYSQFEIAGTVNSKDRYRVNLEETGSFDFGQYIQSIATELQKQNLPVSGSGTAKIEGKIAGTLSDLQLNGQVDLNEVDLNVLGFFRKQAGLKAGISYDVVVDQGIVLLKELRVKDVLSGWKMSGKMDPAADVKAELDIQSDKANLRDLKRYIPGLEQSQIEGRMASSGTVKVTNDTIAFSGELQGDSLNIENVRVDEINGKVTTDNLSMVLDSVNAKMYEGEVGLAGRLNMEQSDKGFELVFHMEDINIGSLVGSISPDVGETISGTLNGDLTVSSSDQDDPLAVEGMEGAGSVKVEDAKLAGLGPVKEVLKWTGEKNTEDMSFDKVEADFSLKDGSLMTDRMELKSKPISLEGSGEIDAQQNMNYDLTVTLAPEVMAQFPSIPEGKSFHIDSKGCGVFQFGLGGTFAEPLLNIPSDLLMELLRLKDRKKDFEKLPPLPDSVPPTRVPQKKD